MTAVLDAAAARIAAAFCTYGLKTIGVLSDMNGILISALDHLDDTLINIGQSQYLMVNTSTLQPFIKNAQNLRRAVKHFITLKTEAEQKKLQDVIYRFNPKMGRPANTIVTKKLGRGSKDNDWLTVEAEILIKNGKTADDAAIILYERLLELPYDQLTKGQLKALETLQNSKDPGEMLNKRLIRKIRKFEDKTVLSAPNEQMPLD